MAKLKVRKSGDAQGLQSKVSLTKRCENGFVFKANVAKSVLGEAKLGELENGGVSGKNGVVMSLDGASALNTNGSVNAARLASGKNAFGKNLGGKNASCKNGVASSNALNANSKSSGITHNALSGALNALNAVRKNAGKLALGALSAAAVLPNTASAVSFNEALHNIEEAENWGAKLNCWVDNRSNPKFGGCKGDNPWSYSKGGETTQSYGYVTTVLNPNGTLRLENVNVTTSLKAKATYTGRGGVAADNGIVGSFGDYGVPYLWSLTNSYTTPLEGSGVIYNIVSSRNESTTTDVITALGFRQTDGYNRHSGRSTGWFKNTSNNIYLVQNNKVGDSVCRVGSDYWYYCSGKPLFVSAAISSNNLAIFRNSELYGDMKLASVGNNNLKLYHDTIDGIEGNLTVDRYTKGREFAANLSDNTMVFDNSNVANPPVYAHSGYYITNAHLGYQTGGWHTDDVKIPAIADYLDIKNNRLVISNSNLSDYHIKGLEVEHLRLNYYSSTQKKMVINGEVSAVNSAVQDLKGYDITLVESFYGRVENNTLFNSAAPQFEDGLKNGQLTQQDYDEYTNYFNTLASGKMFHSQFDFDISHNLTLVGTNVEDGSVIGGLVKVDGIQQWTLNRNGSEYNIYGDTDLTKGRFRSNIYIGQSSKPFKSKIVGVYVENFGGDNGVAVRADGTVIGINNTNFKAGNIAAVYARDSWWVKATNNTVNILSSLNTTGFIAAFADGEDKITLGKGNWSRGREYDYITGNRLRLEAKDIIARNIFNFEYIDFILPTNLKAGDTILSLNPRYEVTDLTNSTFGISAAGAIAVVEAMSESEAKNRGLIATLISTNGYLKLNTTGTGQNITPYTTRLLSGSERYNYNIFANNSVNGGYKQLLVNVTKSDASVVEPILPPVTNNTTTNTTEPIIPPVTNNTTTNTTEPILPPVINNTTANTTTPIVPPVSNNTTTNTTTPTIPITPDGAIPVGPRPNSVTTGANNTFAAGFGNLVVTNASSSDLYGGFSSNGAAFGNAVEVKGVEVNGSVTGGFGSGISGLNKVFIHADSTINGNVTGAHAAQEASRSEVSVTGSLINGEVIGALSQTSHATLTNTSVTNSRVSGNITGAKATLDASNNIVKVTNTSVTGTVIGGIGQKANLNIVSITNSNIYSAAASGNLTAKPVWADTAELDLSGVAVIGGLGSQEAKANIVSVINSTIYGDICAGASKQGGASSNMVMLSGSKVVGKWVNNCVVSFNESQELAANETQPTANLQESNLVLANSLASVPSQTPSAKAFNTMIDTSKPSLITDGAGFASSTNELTFILKEGTQNTQSALVVEGEAADFGGKVANIELVGEFSALQKAGDAQTFNLASNVKNLEVQGLKQTLSFDKSVEVAASLNPYGANQTANQTLTATARVTANVEQKILLQASLAGAVAALNSGEVTGEMIRNANSEGDIAVAAFDAGKFEQDQAGVKSKTYAFSAGFGRSAASSFAGAFVTGGGSSYDTALSVGNSVMNAEGSATFIAAGLFGKFDFGANSATITAKAGVSKTKFDAYAQSGVSLKDFSLNRAFYALQASFERVIEFGDSLSLSPFAAFSLALIESKSVAISGLDYDFEAITSAKASIGARVEMALRLGEGELKTSLTAAYEEELSGEADAINANLGNPYSLKSLFGAPSLKGGSGTLSLSADYKPKGEGGFVVGVKLKGSVGENKGVGGSLSVGYKF